MIERVVHPKGNVTSICVQDSVPQGSEKSFNVWWLFGRRSFFRGGKLKDTIRSSAEKQKKQDE